MFLYIKNVPFWVGENLGELLNYRKNSLFEEKAVFSIAIYK
jgi:hypothetical protein